MAHEGDTIEIDGGDYPGDVAIWARDRITIRGVNGRPRLIANGASVEGKAIWVVRAVDLRMENIEFVGARVPDRNGAGIRFERGSLRIKGCVFRDNENGILTGGDPDAILEIEDSEFDHNGSGDGYSHNLYVGAIARLVVKGSYFHRANVGHLLKSRARDSRILYNRLTDETEGRASYELEFPNGGLAIVIGNVIQQSDRTENPVIVAFGREGYSRAPNELYLSHNTIVNDRKQGGVFILAEPGADVVQTSNNLLVGPGSVRVPANRISRGDIALPDRTQFVDAKALDLRLKRSSPLRGKATPSESADGSSLRPTAEFAGPTGTRPVESTGPLSPGAIQSTGT
ncbi:MAG: hypothetical protein ABI794_00055 [Betaproteobacteria bacterium]